MLNRRGCLTGLLPMVLLAQVDSRHSDELYYIAFLRPLADRKPISKEEGERIQAAHMANIGSMAERGVLVAAGPFEDSPRTISGVFIFKVESIEEAKRIANQDPTVVEHRNAIDVYQWKGPGGIGEEYTRLHRKDANTPVDMGVHPFLMLYGRLDQKILLQHDEYLAKLRQSGKIVAAGPILNAGDDVQAILIFKRGTSDDEAQQLANQDPAVKSGMVRVESHHWWCAAHVLPQD